jgi:hypothetical protein
VSDTQATIRLNVISGGDATAKLKEAAEAARDLSRAEQEHLARLQQTTSELQRQEQAARLRRGGQVEVGGRKYGLDAQGRLAEGAGNPNLDRAAGQAGSGLMSFARVAALATAGLMGLSRVAQGAARITETVNNSYLTAREKQQRILEGIPLLGSGFAGLRGLANAVSGLSESMRQLGETRAHAETLARGLHGVQLAGIGQQARAGVAADQAAALGVVPVDRRIFYRGWGLAGVEAEERQRLQLSEVNVGRARARYVASLASAGGARDAEAQARLAVGRAERVELSQHQQVRQIRSARTTAAGAVRDPRVTVLEAAAFFGWDRRPPQLLAAQAAAPSQLDLQNGLHDQAQGLQRLIEANQRLRAAVESRGEADRSVAQAASALRQAETAALREQLSILEQRERVAQQSAQRLGGMSRLQRQMGIQALESVLAHGPANVPQEWLSLARGIAPQRVAELETRGGMRAPELARLRQLAPADYRDVAELEARRREVDRLRAEVNVRVQLDERALARELADQLRGFIAELRVLTTREARLAAEAARVGQQIRNASGGS